MIAVILMDEELLSVRTITDVTQVPKRTKTPRYSIIASGPPVGSTTQPLNHTCGRPAGWFSQFRRDTSEDSGHLLPVAVYHKMTATASNCAEGSGKLGSVAWALGVRFDDLVCCRMLLQDVPSYSQ